MASGSRVLIRRRQVVAWNQLAGFNTQPSGRPVAKRVAHPPATIEKLRRTLPTLRDATPVSLIAYAGLRPGEALALTWGDIGERSLSIDKAVSFGVEKEAVSAEKLILTARNGHDYQNTKKALFPRESTKPSAGLEPATPSLPLRSGGGLPIPFFV